MPMIHCPVCDLEFSPEKRSDALPFCSKRCKLVDQGRWLGEEYGLPFESEESQIPDYDEIRDSVKNAGRD